MTKSVNVNLAYYNFDKGGFAVVVESYLYGFFWSDEKSYFDFTLRAVIYIITGESLELGCCTRDNLKSLSWFSRFLSVCVAWKQHQDRCNQWYLYKLRHLHLYLPKGLLYQDL